jgi:spermidine synthase
MEEEDIHLEGVRIHGDGATMRLSQKAGVYTIWVGEVELMSSSIHKSEDELAKIVCGMLAHLPEAKILIGGLGMGFTLAAALKVMGPKGKVVVAELMPAVLAWNRGVLADLAGRPLEDPRVVVKLQDVAHSLQTELAEYDGILLDVDNGPEGLTRGSNDWLYSQDGIAAAYTALRPNGILAIWSSTPDKTFGMRLRKAGFDVEERSVDSSTEARSDRHTIFLAVNRS